MTLNNDQERDLNYLIALGQSKIEQDEAADAETFRATRQHVIAAFKIPDSLQEFVIAGKPGYEFGNHYIWLLIPTLLPIKLTFGTVDHGQSCYASSCTVMHGEESHYCHDLNEALAVAQKLVSQPIPSAAQKIDEDTINAAYDELERTTRVAHQSQPDWQWSVEIAEQKVRRLSAILNFRTKTLLMDRYQNQDA